MDIARRSYSSRFTEGEDVDQRSEAETSPLR
jgi:hypothetical protein